MRMCKSLQKGNNMKNKELFRIAKIRNKCMLLCISILFLCLITSLFRYAVIKGLVKAMHVDNAIIRMIVNDDSLFKEDDDRHYDWKWQEKYPFIENENDGNKDEIAIKHITVFEHNGKQPSDKLDTWGKDNLFGYYYLVEKGRSWERFIKWDELPVPSNEGKNYVQLNDGVLTFLVSRQNFSKHVDNLCSFSEWCAIKNISFLYVQAPTKCRPALITDDIHEKMDNDNKNLNDIIKYIKENNIPYLDLREDIMSSDIDWHSLFFKTDHHWKPSTGLWASRKIADKINILYGLDINASYMVEDRYDIKHYDNCFLGSHGKKASLAKVDLEGIDIFVPKYLTDIRYVVMSSYNNIDLQGDFLVYYEMDRLNDTNYYLADAYSIYGYGTQGVQIIYNNLNSDGRNVLLLKDSFAMAVMPFFAQGVHTLHTIDRRGYDGSIKSYIEKNDIDVVIVFYGDAITSDGTENSKRFFDFR